MSKSDISKLDFDQCALCAKSSDLQVSHIIPRFVFNWFRESSATGHFRFSQTPNLRVQDGLKVRMLCRECEHLFSFWEKKFSEECFFPINNGRVQKLEYGPWMLKFATSVSWRVLSAFVASDELSGYPPHILTEATEALSEWRRFLLGHQPHPGRREQHMFLVDVVEDTSIANVPPNINRYLTRAIECYVAHTQDSAITYAKMGRFVLFGFLVMQHPDRWRGTKLNADRGIFGVQDLELPSDVGDFIMDRARLCAEKYSQISEQQRRKIRESYERDPDRVTRSESLRAMHHDVLLFGKNAFEVTRPVSQKTGKKSNDLDDS